MESKGKIVFANQLRGVAAMFIVVTHYFGIFFGAQGAVAATTFSPNLNTPIPDWIMLFVFKYFSTGPFGVALFFLISGFVIAFSLEQARPAEFLVRRLFRIYPTYLACLAVSMLAVAASAMYWGQPFTHSARDLVANALLVNHNMGIASVDMVNWSLSVEIKFYLLMALCGGWFLRRNFWAVAAFGLLVLAATWQLRQAGPDLSGLTRALLESLVVEANFVLFMLLGSFFHQNMAGRLPMAQLLLRALPMLAVFNLAWAIGPVKAQFYIVPLNYIFAWLVFLACYLARDWFRPTKVLDFFADISYPLYLLHSLAGYALLKVLMHHGWPFFGALAVVFPLVLLLCHAVHRLVELPSNALGRCLSKRWATGGGQRLPPAV